jgi:hypothetical protein
VIQSVLLAVLAAAPATISAQMRMTMAGGVAVSRLTGDGVDDFSGMRNRRGLYVNVAADIPLLGEGMLSFFPGGAYVDRGFTFDEEDFESALKLSYVQLLAPLRLAIPVAGPVGVHFFVGPGFGISFGCLYTRRQPGTITSFDCTNDQFSFKSIDVTAMGGGGLFFRMPNDTRIMLSGALDTSLVSIDSSPSDLDLRHRSILITAGVLYPLNR